MGIDLIENSELSAFDYSRLGNKSFADDDTFSNGSGKRDRERDRQNAFNYWQFPIPKDKLNDCEFLNLQLTKLNNALEENIQKFTKKSGIEKFVNPLREIITGYKNAIATAKCVEKSEKKREEEAKKDLLQVIDAETRGGGTEALQQLKGRPSADGSTTTGMSKNVKIALFGIGGLLAAVIVIAIIKKSRQS